jgi:hypothetical protein
VIRIDVAGYELDARLEQDLSPRTVAFFRTMLPYETKLIQVVDGLEHLPAIAELVLWQGAQDISFAVA